MTGLTMYDTDQNDQFPAGAQAYAAYVDGAVGDQPNYGYIVREFPQAHHLSIAVFAKDNADCLDVENFAASPADIPGWYARQRARGVTRPCVYASANTMETYVVPLIWSGAVSRAAVRLWSAHYGQGEHICGPVTCKLTSIGMDGTQWTSDALGRNLDQSLLSLDFFGPVQQYVEVDMSKVPVLREGTAGQFVRNWQGQLVAHGYGYLIAPPATPPLEHVDERAGIDGAFGPLTRTATVRFQEDRRLNGTGVVALAEWEAAVSG